MTFRWVMAGFAAWAAWGSALPAQGASASPKAVPRTRPPAQAPSGGQPLIGTLGADAALALSGNRRDGPAALPSGIARSRLGPGGHGLRGDLYVPLLVRDAPAYGRGSSTLEVQPVSPTVVSEPAFYPTMQPPVWHIVPDEHPVQAWRLVDVDDVICYPSGQCAPVTTRVIARWVPALRAYAFRDRVGRIWPVE